MALDATARRRLFGALVLALALAMLIAGETVLRGRLNALEFMFYWLVCLVLTGLAIVVALRDLRALRRRNLEEQRNLFQATLKQIATEARARPRRQDKPGPAEPGRAAGKM